MADLPARETAAAFGLGAVRSAAGPVASGRMGVVHRLVTERGAFAVKVADEPLDASTAEAVAAHQEAFGAAGVSTPGVRRALDGSAQATLRGVTVRVSSWVEIAAPDRRLDPVAVGRLLAHLHSVRLPATGPVEAWFTEPVGAAGWRTVVAGLRAARAPYADRLDALVPGLVAAEQRCAPPRDLQVCHRDLWADNLRAGSAGPVVLDWDAAGPADPSHELALVVLEFACGEDDRARTLVSAYVDAGGPGRLRSLEDFSMLWAVQGHLVAEGCRRWLAAGTEDERAANEAWVAEFLDEPWLVPEAEALLDALGGG